MQRRASVHSSFCSARTVAGRSVLDDLERSLHPVSAFLVIPVFALADAGVDLRGDALGRPLTWAIIPASS
ncbi:Na+/H+ antiporter NhaA [Streptomyces chilikensis]|uniref:Na+/H+ antiporter NhaA n=1 Tax=Streptomyces chilikensis TaxID=1194079 RepID=A0ABV3EIW5_9ACTN